MEEISKAYRTQCISIRQNCFHSPFKIFLAKIIFDAKCLCILKYIVPTVILCTTNIIVYSWKTLKINKYTFLTVKLVFLLYAQRSLSFMY